MMLSAEPGSSEDLFGRGRAELKAGHALEALKLFEDSYALQPALGTLLNIADCAERLDRLEQSWQYFSDARAWAERVKEYDRVDATVARLRMLEGRLTIVSVICAAGRPAVRVGTRAVTCGQQFPLAPGLVEVDATAPSARPFHLALEGHAGERLVIAIPELLPEVRPPPPEPCAVCEEPLRRSSGIAARRGLLIGGVALSLVSMAALAVSISVWNAYAIHLVNPRPDNAVDEDLARTMVSGVYPAGWVGLGVGVTAVIVSAVWGLLLDAPQPTVALRVVPTWAAGPAVAASWSW